MKKKIFTLLTLLVACVTGAWADDYYTPTSDEVIILSENMSGTGDNAGKGTSTHDAFSFGAEITSLGSQKCGDPSNNGAATASSVTCYAIKGNGGVKNLTATISGCTKLVVYHNSHSSRFIKAEITPSVGDASVQTGSVSTYYTEISLDASKSYSIFIYGWDPTAKSGAGDKADLYAYALKLILPTAGVPTINTQPVGAEYEVNAASPAALTVAATASTGGGDLSYQWYKNDTETTEGATLISGAESSSYTPDVSAIGTTYYYCNVSDNNGNVDTDFAEIVVVGASMPNIEYAVATNTVTITKEGTGDLYYTLDNSLPTSSSSPYTVPFTVDNSCTVRAIKVLNGNNSAPAFKNCYVDHSDKALAVLGHGGGSSADGVWTSTDGNYKLSSSNGSSVDYYTLFTNSDGFKLNHTNDYTLKVGDDIKVTSIKVVGISRGDAVNDATIALTGFTPASGTVEKGTFVKTIEFTPSSELDYGAEIEIITGGNQFGAYFEIYGEKRQGPTASEPVYGTAVTWDFSTSDAQTTALNGGSFTASAENTLYDTEKATTIVYSAGSGDELNASGYLKSNGTTSDSNKRYFILNITKSGKLQIFSKSTFGTYAIKKAAESSTSWSSATDVTTITTKEEGTGVFANITYDSEKPYLFIGLSSKAYTQKLIWTPATDDITLTTTTNMAGWRAFYDASNSYSVDANTKVYVAANAPEGSTITLTSIEGIPANVPVILHTSSSADNYKMTLTKKTSDPYTYTGDNNLIWATSAVSEKYRLGFGGSGIGFYPYSGTPTSGAVILNVSSAAGAPTLAIDFGNSTGVNDVRSKMEDVRGEYYNLAGQRVANPTKGLYIVNGKKVIVK